MTTILICLAGILVLFVVFFLTSEKFRHDLLPILVKISLNYSAINKLIPVHSHVFLEVSKAFIFQLTNKELLIKRDMWADDSSLEQMFNTVIESLEMAEVESKALLFSKEKYRIKKPEYQKVDLFGENRGCFIQIYIKIIDEKLQAKILGELNNVYKTMEENKAVVSAKFCPPEFCKVVLLAFNESEKPQPKKSKAEEKKDGGHTLAQRLPGKWIMSFLAKKSKTSPGYAFRLSYEGKLPLLPEGWYWAEESPAESHDDYALVSILSETDPKDTYLGIDQLMPVLHQMGIPQDTYPEADFIRDAILHHTEDLFPLSIHAPNQQQQAIPGTLLVGRTIKSSDASSEKEHAVAIHIPAPLENGNNLKRHTPPSPQLAALPDPTNPAHTLSGTKPEGFSVPESKMHDISTLQKAFGAHLDNHEKNADTLETRAPRKWIISGYYCLPSNPKIGYPIALLYIGNDKPQLPVGLTWSSEFPLDTQTVASFASANQQDFKYPSFQDLQKTFLHYFAIPDDTHPSAEQVRHTLILQDKETASLAILDAMPDYQPPLTKTTIHNLTDYGECYVITAFTEDDCEDSPEADEFFNAE